MSAPSSSPKGPAALTGSEDAKRKMAVILEAIAGLRTIQSACEELGIAAVRYYALETRMLQGMVDALEPRKRGRKVDLQAELDRQRAAAADLERELLRVKALYRTTQRAVGVKDRVDGAAKKKKTTRSRRPRKTSRGERLASRLKGPEADTLRPSRTMDSKGGDP